MTKPSGKPYLKPFISVPEQLNRLQSRGLIIEDIEKTTELLSHINYYRLEAYWFTFYDFQKKDHVFKPRTTFDIIWKHYRFDRRLRAIISHALERIEVSFRTQFTHYLAQNFGPFPFESKNFVFDSGEWIKENTKLEESCEKSREQFALHFYKKYSGELLPIWALVEVVSFGTVVRYYKKIKSIPIKNQISEVYDLQPKELTSWMDHLNYVRNICAHHSRLWNKRLTKSPKSPSQSTHPLLSQMWNHPPVNGERNIYFNDRRIYNTILVIDYFLSKICPKNSWRKDVISLIEKYSIDSKRMGFPYGWRDDDFWKA